MHLQVNTRSRVERRANATKSAAVGERLDLFYVKSALRQFSVRAEIRISRKHVPAETPARASRVGAAPGIGMSSKKAAARRRRAAEPDVSVAVARAERRLEKFSAARSGSSSRGASLGDAVAYAAIALGMCLMLFSRRIPVHGPEDFAPMRRAGRLAARALAHVEPHVRWICWPPSKIPVEVKSRDDGVCCLRRGLQADTDGLD